MLQDLERGRPTEIDAINGYVAARGDALGIPTPVNATLTRMIRARVRRPRALRGAMDTLTLDRAALDEMLAHARETASRRVLRRGVDA